MNFDELFNYCTKLNESSAEKCLVCHIPIEKDDMHIKLKCNHYYHPNCIKYIKGSVKCMYCEKISIPTIINNDNTLNIIDMTNTCHVIMKTGLKKGMECGRMNCKYHNKICTCTVIMKSGKKKGDMCNRTLPCGYHKEKDNNEIEV